LLLILVAVEQLVSILEDSDKRINAVLTAEQQKALRRRGTGHEGAVKGAPSAGRSDHLTSVA
jgi:hypothetical protein